MPPSWRDATPIDSVGAWNECAAELPAVLERLLNSKRFNAVNPPPDNARGAFLFSDQDRPLYIGRTTIASRAKAKGTTSTSFLAHWNQQADPGSRPNEALLAGKLAAEFADLHGIETPPMLKVTYDLRSVSHWYRLRNLPIPPDYCVVFDEAKRYVREELDFRIVKIDDDVQGIRSHLAGLYAGVVLQAPYGEFSA